MGQLLDLLLQVPSRVGWLTSSRDKEDPHPNPHDIRRGDSFHGRPGEDLMMVRFEQRPNPISVGNSTRFSSGSELLGPHHHYIPKPFAGLQSRRIEQRQSASHCSSSLTPLLTSEEDERLRYFGGVAARTVPWAHLAGAYDKQAGGLAVDWPFSSPRTVLFAACGGRGLQVPPVLYCHGLE